MKRKNRAVIGLEKQPGSYYLKKHFLFSTQGLPLFYTSAVLLLKVSPLCFDTLLGISLFRTLKSPFLLSYHNGYNFFSCLQRFLHQSIFSHYFHS